MSSISSAYDKEIRPYIDLIDQFRAFGVQQDCIDLPQICVMGDQSSGKSSVLQAISGQLVLPIHRLYLPLSHCYHA